MTNQGLTVIEVGFVAFTSCFASVSVTPFGLFVHFLIEIITVAKNITMKARIPVTAVIPNN